MKLKLTRDLSPLRDQAKKRVMDEAVKVINKITVTEPTQVLIYSEKVAQAQAFLLDGSMSELLVTEAALREITPAEMANNIILRAAQARGVRMMIELLRSQANVDIDAAKTPAQIEQASVVDWNFNG